MKNLKTINRSNSPKIQQPLQSLSTHRSKINTQ